MKIVLNFKVDIPVNDETCGLYDLLEMYADSLDIGDDFCDIENFNLWSSGKTFSVSSDRYIEIEIILKEVKLGMMKILELPNVSIDQDNPVGVWHGDVCTC